MSNFEILFNQLETQGQNALTSLLGGLVFIQNKLDKTSSTPNGLPSVATRLAAYDANGAEGIIDTTNFSREDLYKLAEIERKHGKLPA